MAMAQVIVQPPLAQQTYPWVVERINSAVDTVHFESSMYGPLNTIMHGIFPAQQMFMVKPQGILRKEANGDVDSHNATYNTSGSTSNEGKGDRSVDSNILAGLDGTTDEISEALNRVGNDGTVAQPPEGGDIFSDEREFSLDSYAGWVPPRNPEKGKGRGPGTRKTQDASVGYPDFVVVKATAALDNDTLIGIVEVKRDGESIIQGVRQLSRYLKFAAPKANRAPCLRGFLVAGSITHVYELDGPGPFADTRPIGQYPTNTNLWVDLHAIAGQFWG